MGTRPALIARLIRSKRPRRRFRPMVCARWHWKRNRWPCEASCERSQSSCPSWNTRWSGSKALWRMSGGSRRSPADARSNGPSGRERMLNQPTRQGRILIVEDQGIVATDIERCLEDEGFEVTGIARSMEAAVREASRCRPDLVLMDIRIQGKADGIDAADHLHRHLGLPVVYLTAHDDRDTMARARRTEPMAFLIKPFKPAELISTVEIALSRSWAERELRERERSFLSAMDAIGDAVLTSDSQGRVRFMNRAAEELTGWRQESALGRQSTEVVEVVNQEVAGAERFRALLDFHGTPESDSDHEYRLLARSGVEHWVTIKATNIAGANDRSIRVVVMQDITRRKQSEQALRRQADLLDQSQDAIFTWDMDGAISYWNRGAQALYGYSAAEALGRARGEL